MMAAEKWLEYEDSYRKYGVDMKPIEHRERVHKDSSVMYAKDKIRLLGLTIFAGLLGIAMIILAAYGAQLKYDINVIVGENTVIEGEIENLNVEMKKSTNIATIETRATQELGMTYPGGNQIVYLGADDNIDGGFAMLLKEQAYN